MVKFWTFAFIGIALLVGVAKCDDEQTLFENSEELVKNFPRYLKEAMLEEEEEEKKANVTNLRIFARHQCLKDYLKIFGSIASRKMWALQVIDSWGKFPSGVVRGNMYELGDYDECLISVDQNVFPTRYCVARIAKEELVIPKAEFTSNALKTLHGVLREYMHNDDDELDPRIVPTTSNMLGLNFGICLPKSCTENKIQNTLKKLQKRILFNKAVLTVVPETCQTKEDMGWNLETADWFCVMFPLLFLALMIFSTTYDLIKTRQEKEKVLLFTAFSVYTNAEKLFVCRPSRSENTMECLNGIRVFSALWVIFAHAHVMTMMGPLYNFAYVPEFTKEKTTILTLMAPLSVDTFLYLSGLLVTWSLLRQMNKTKGKVNVPMMYFHRYLRLTPALALITFFSATIFKKMASGPLWFLFVNHSINCEKYWWSSLLYIQNYYNVDSICLSHTWYLSVDMQLFLFSPLLAYCLYRFGYAFVPVLGILIGICIGWTYWLYVDNNLVNQLLSINNDIQKTFNLTYFPTHVRITPWVVGVGFAFLLAKVHRNRERWSIIRVVLHWGVTLGVFIALTIYNFDLQQFDHKGDSVESGLYTPFSRLVWSLLLCMLIYGCVKGYGGPVNWFLSLPQWQPLARLTYLIYLSHMPVMLLTVASTRRPAIFSGRLILFKFMGDFLIATIISVILALAIESPIVVLEKVMFTPKKRTTENVLPTSETFRSRRDSTETAQPSAPQES